MSLFFCVLANAVRLPILTTIAIIAKIAKLANLALSSARLSAEGLQASQSRRKRTIFAWAILFWRRVGDVSD